MSAAVTPPPEKAASDPRALGSLTKMLSRVLGHMPATERAELMQDAATFTSSELGRASEELGKATDMSHPGEIQDQWSQPLATVPNFVNTGGPGSSVAPGSIPVGSTQEASGAGADRMESTYSRHAPQNAVQTATERLGRVLMSHGASMKAIIAATDGLNTQIQVLKSGNAMPDTAALQTLIGDAVAKAVNEAIAPLKADLMRAVAKADKKKEDDEEDDDEAKFHEKAKAAEPAVKAENDAEGDTSADAAALRLMAKSRVDFAKVRISKALDAVAEDKPKAADRAYALAGLNLAKAQDYVERAIALRDGTIGPSSEVIVQQIAKARSGLPKVEVKMQDTWPNSTEKKIGPTTIKAEETAKTDPSNAAVGPTQDLAKAMEQIQAAASGMGMLQASVSELIGALQRGHSGGDGAGGGALPPVFALAKAGSSDIANREAELARLRDQDVISFDDHDRARDALTHARMGMPEDTVAAMVARLPDAARHVFTRSNAA